MKTRIFPLILMLLLGFTFSSCEKEELPENPYDPYSTNYTGYNKPGNNNPDPYNPDPYIPDNNVVGTIVFWSDFYGAPISVYIEGSYQGDISVILSSAPSCGASGCVTVTLNPGTYNYTANDGNYSWANSFTISSNTCLRYRLKE